MNDFTTALADDLADLAGTMPTDPTRLSSVRRRARRLRSQQLASRGVKATATVALAVGGLAAVQSGPGTVELVPAAGPTPTTLPACAAVPPPEPKGAPSSATDAETLKRKGAPSSSSTDTASAMIDADTMKGSGIISARPDATTVTVATKTDDQAGNVTFLLSATTSVVDGAGAQPNLAVGAPVAFVVSRNAGGPWTAEKIEVHPAVIDKTADKTSDDAVGDRVKSTGVVRGPVTASAISIAVTDGPLRGQTIALVVDGSAQYFVGDTACSAPELADGVTVGFSARVVASSYHLEAMQLR